MGGGGGSQAGVGLLSSLILGYHLNAAQFGSLVLLSKKKQTKKTPQKKPNKKPLLMGSQTMPVFTGFLQYSAISTLQLL